MTDDTEKPPGGRVIPFPVRAPDYSVEPTHDDLARWLFHYARLIEGKPSEEAETIIALQQECERVNCVDGDWVHGLITICQALLANHRSGDEAR
jgi:hypothetical protein